MFQSNKNNRVRNSVGSRNMSQKKATRRAVLNWEGVMEQRVMLASNLIIDVSPPKQKTVDQNNSAAVNQLASIQKLSDFSQLFDATIHPEYLNQNGTIASRYKFLDINNDGKITNVIEKTQKGKKNGDYYDALKLINREVKNLLSIEISTKLLNVTIKEGSTYGLLENQLVSSSFSGDANYVVYVGDLYDFNKPQENPTMLGINNGGAHVNQNNPSYAIVFGNRAVQYTAGVLTTGKIDPNTNRPRTLELLPNQDAKSKRIAFIGGISRTIVHEFLHLLGVGHPFFKVPSNIVSGTNTIDDKIRITNQVDTNGDIIKDKYGKPVVTYFAQNPIDSNNNIMNYNTKIKGSGLVSTFQEFAVVPNPGTGNYYVDTTNPRSAFVLQSPAFELTASLKGAQLNVVNKNNVLAILDDLVEDAYVSYLPAADTNTAIEGTLSGKSLSFVTGQIQQGIDLLKTKALGLFTNSLELSKFALPLNNKDIRNVFQVDNAFSSVLNKIDTSNLQSWSDLSQYLTNNGFYVDYVTDSNKVSDPLSQNNAFDFVKARVSIPISASASFELDSSGLSALKDLGLSLSGTLNGKTDLALSFVFGVDTSGFYIGESDILSGQVNILGDVSCNVGSIATVNGYASLNLVPVVNLTSSDPDGRIRLADLVSNPSKYIHSDFVGDFNTILDASIGSTTGLPLNVTGSWYWRIDSNNGLSYDSKNSGFDTSSLIESVAEVALTNIKDLFSQSQSIASVVKDIPVVGTDLADKLSNYLTSLISFDESGYQPILQSLEDNGFTISTDLSVGSFLDGSYLNKDFFKVSYSRTVTPQLPKFATSGKIDMNNIDLHGNLTGVFQLDDNNPDTINDNPSLTLNVGLVINSGGFSLDTSLPLLDFKMNPSIGFDGDLRIGKLVQLKAHAQATFPIHARVEFGAISSGSSFNLDNLAFAFNNSPVFKIDGAANFSLTVSAENPAINIPFIGKYIQEFLPTFDWDANAIFQYSSTAGDLQPLYSVTTPSDQLEKKFSNVLKNASAKALMGAEGLSKYNPIPSSIRDLLSTKMYFIGNQSLADLTGLSSALGFLISPNDTNQVDSIKQTGSISDNDHIKLNYDIVNRPDGSFNTGNILNFLSGKPVDIISLDVNKNFPLASIDKSLYSSPLATFFGLVGVGLDVKLTGKLSVGMKFNLGIDSTGLYIRDESNILSLTGELGVELDIEARLLDALQPAGVSLDFAGVKGKFALIVSGGVGIQSASSDQKSRNFLPNSLNVGLDLGIDFTGSIGNRNLQLSKFDLYHGIVPIFHNSLVSDNTKTSNSASDQIQSKFKQEANKYATCILSGSFVGGIGGAISGALLCDQAYKFADQVAASVGGYDNARVIAATAAFGPAGGAVVWAYQNQEVINKFGVDANQYINDRIRAVPGGDLLVDGGTAIANGVKSTLESMLDLGKTSTKTSEITPEPKYTFKVPNDQDVISSGVLDVNWISNAPAKVHISSRLNSDGTKSYVISSEPFIVEEPAKLVEEIKQGIFGKEVINSHIENAPWQHNNIMVLSKKVSSAIQTIKLNGTESGDFLMIDPNISAQVKIYGFGGNDTIGGGTGSDTIDGGDGEDSLIGGDGSDYILGGQGNDTITGVFSNDTLDGGDGNDLIASQVSNSSNSLGNNWIYGGQGNDTIQGSSGIDFISGGSGNDTIMENGGNNTIWGNEGDDTIRGSSDSDIIYGGDGKDFIYGATGEDQLFGESGEDFLSGDDGADLLDGGTGQDVIEGGNGNDTITGGSDADFIHGESGNDVIYGDFSSALSSDGSDGNDLIFGDEGNDLLYAGGGGSNKAVFGTQGSKHNIVSGGSGEDTIYGGNAVDMIDTGAGDDYVEAAGGDDTVLGSDGNDTIYGGIGDDILESSVNRVDLSGGYVSGDSGNDTIFGQAGRDTLLGGEGQDVIMGRESNDIIMGGTEADQIVWTVGDGTDTVDGGDGSDAILVRGTVNSTSFAVSPNQDLLKQISIVVQSTQNQNSERLRGADIEEVKLFGGSSSDLFDISSLEPTTVTSVQIELGSVSSTDDEEDVMPITDGDDSNSKDIVKVHLSQHGSSVSVTPLSTGDGIDINNLYALVRVLHSAINDTLAMIGGIGNDRIAVAEESLQVISVLADGKGGDDYIQGAQTAIGGSGNDTLIGTSGGDILLGDQGNDFISSLDGNDLILGDATGTGIASGITLNTLVIQSGFVITPAQVFVGNDTILGGDGADTINGGAGNDSIDGGDGADTIGVLITALNPILPSGFLEPGNDLISGGLGDDSIQAGDGNDSVFGNEGQDLIAGQAGNDTIDGGTGNDTILGNDDNDSILGGDGKDTIDGGAGDDYIAGNNDDDSMIGAAGADTIDGGDGADILFGNDGNDSILGDLGNDSIDGGTGDDAIAGNAGNDSILGGDGNDTIDGADGNDVIQGNAGDDSIMSGLGLDSIHGGLGVDFIRGDEGNDSLCGGPDDSEKVDPALDGPDTIFGGSGNDAINGDAGDDFLNGGVGNDQLWGNDGNDTIGVFVYNGVTQFEPGNDSMIGGLGNDLIAGALVDAAGKPVNDGNDVMFGQEGNDTIWGGAGGDMIYGGDGNDVMLGGTPLTANTLHAPRNGKLPNDGNDTMFGGNGFDKVDGGNNNNLLDAGNDGIRETVLGGKGNDMGYSHTLQDPVNFDVLALDGGFNHKFCDGGLEEPPVPAASCTYIAWAIPSNFFTGVKTLKNGDIVEHPSLDYRTKPNNGPNGPVIKSVKIQSSKVTVSKTTLVKSAVSKSSTSFAGKSKTVGKLSSGLGKLQVAKG